MQRCPNCTGEHRCVGSVGPETSPYLFVGEKPGKDEDRLWEPFVGKTGQEVNAHYLPLAGLKRENIRLTNAIKCWGGEGNADKVDIKRAKDRALLQSCSETHLYPEIESMNPRLLIPMGAFACYALDPGINLELQHGIPVQTRWGTAFPMFHPAQGLHEPKRMLLIRTDWDRLRKYIRGTLKLPVDQFAGREDYRELKKPAQVTSILRNYYTPLACDTEIRKYNRKNPHCITFSVEPGTGYMIKAESRACLDAFQGALNRWKAPILFHNYLFDCEVVSAMGLRFPERWIRDTMVMSYHLGNLPQGLKALGYRLLGTSVQDFDDVVTPYSTPLCLRYLRMALDCDWQRPEPELIRGDNGKWKVYRPQSMRTKLKRFFTDYQKNPEIDIFERWKNWGDSHTVIEQEMGEWPSKCITHAPESEALFYAAKDADMTLRLYHVLRAMQKRVRKSSQENW